MALETTGYDTRPYWVSNAQRGTEKLLAALIEHHDFSVSPPKGWKPRKINPPIPIASIPEPPRLWFTIDEEAVAEPKIADIKRATCKYFEITKIDIDSTRRTMGIVYPRQLAYFLSKTLTHNSFPEIGRRFGGRDHTTVLHGFRKIERESRDDWKVAYDLASIEALL